MSATLHTAVQPTRSAATLILTGLDRIDSVRITEKRKHDFVTSVDKAVEHEMIETLQQAYPSHQFLSEERFAHTKLNDKDDFWIIDPIDGTTNFIYGIPHFAISVAFMSKGRLECAVVYDPVKDEMFTAIRGAGARLNQRRIRVSPRTNINGALIATGTPGHDSVRQNSYVRSLQALLPEVGSFRRSGSAALDLAYVAAGRFDGFIDVDLYTWDVAAGHLLVKEAGGHIKDFSGRSGLFITESLIAGNNTMFDALQPIMTSVS